MMPPISPCPPVNPIVGSMWTNSVSNQVHVFDGSNWVWVAGLKDFPKTWEEWFVYYINSVDGFVPNSVKRGYVHEEMRARFPGNYQVDVVQGNWDIVFATPADETWFRLKYD